MGIRNLREKLEKNFAERICIKGQRSIETSPSWKDDKVVVIIPRTLDFVVKNQGQCFNKKVFKAIKYFFLILMGKKIKWEVSLCQLTFNALPDRLIGWHYFSCLLVAKMWNLPPIANYFTSKWSTLKTFAAILFNATDIKLTS